MKTKIKYSLATFIVLVVLILLFLPGIPGCPMLLETSEPSASAKNALAEYGARKIIADAKEMIKKVEIKDSQWVDIPQNLWPDSIAAFKPDDISASEDEIKMVLNQSGRYLNGVKIYIETPEYIKDSYNDASSTISAGSGYGEFKMAEGISWFYEKRRY